jgi:hypothetical protein
MDEPSAFIADGPTTGPEPARARVAVCRHCSTPIVRDNDGRWVHTSLRYACRDRWGTTLPTSAEAR